MVELARDVFIAVSNEPDLELAARPELSTVVFRYVPPGLDKLDQPEREREIAALNNAIRAALYRSGRAMVAATKVDGRQFLKLTLLNPLATVGDIVGVIDLVRETGAALAASSVVEPVEAALEVAR